MNLGNVFKNRLIFKSEISICLVNDIGGVNYGTRNRKKIFGIIKRF